MANTKFLLLIPAAIVVAAASVSGCGLARKYDERRQVDTRIECHVADESNPGGPRKVVMVDPSTCARMDGRV